MKKAEGEENVGVVEREIEVWIGHVDPK